MSRRRLSVVVPCYRDDVALAGLLPALTAMRPPPDEIVVVDAGGGDGVRRLCRRYGARWMKHWPCRGAQLAAGAGAATGDALWFLHADTRPPSRGAAAVCEALEAGAVGGCFRFAFDRGGIGTRLLAQSINLRARLGVPYGDQGLFAAREAYEAAGGFPALPLFEEVALVRGLRRLGRFPMLKEPIAVSARRWRDQGWIRRTLANRWLALRYAAGADPWALAGIYQRRPDLRGEDGEQVDSDSATAGSGDTGS